MDPKITIPAIGHHAAETLRELKDGWFDTAMDQASELATVVDAFYEWDLCGGYTPEGIRSPWDNPTAGGHLVKLARDYQSSYDMGRATRTSAKRLAQAVSKQFNRAI